MSTQETHDHPLFARFWKLAAPGAMSGRDRDELLGGLSGQVVEVGAGTGVNFAHVVAQRDRPAAFQRLLDRSGVWPKLGAGCHVARDTSAALAASGFDVVEERRFMSGLGPFALPHITGVARR